MLPRCLAGVISLALAAVALAQQPEVKQTVRGKVVRVTDGDTLAVLVDKTATRSCTLPVSRAAGRDVTTLEGLGTPEKPDAVQAAFIAEQAAQCGYCTNGMIMAAKALLARTPKPSVDQIKQALDGNLCRCGTHTRIVRAIQRASEV